MTVLFFTHLQEHDAFNKLREAVTDSSFSTKSRTPSLIYEAASDILDYAERCALRGDLWEIYFARLLAEDENTLGHLCELGPQPEGDIAKIASSEIWMLHKIISAAKNLIETEDIYNSLRPMQRYRPSARTAALTKGGRASPLAALASDISSAKTPERMLLALIQFYCENGSGIFALNRAFRWSGSRGLVPIHDLGSQRLSDLIGYEEQKRELTANTELFLNGLPANNVLLFGDSGTGKSSSVRALLGERDFVRRGLRMIELHKDQFADIPEILDLIRFRNYKFILFMDDLSFEEFEIEYKHLKALIEGGLERRPPNTLIYATSNRRNIVREVWSDRKRSSDDVHGADTMQEKLSLADRFGTTIWYGAAGKSLYLDIVKTLLGEYDLSIDEPELERRAMRWEIERGGFTGRAATQFVQHLLTENGYPAEKRRKTK